MNGYNIFIFVDGRHIGINPIKITVFTAIFDNSTPCFSCFQFLPHVVKSGFRHVRVADHVMR